MLCTAGESVLVFNKYIFTSFLYTFVAMEALLYFTIYINGLLLKCSYDTFLDLPVVNKTYLVTRAFIQSNQVLLFDSKIAYS